MNAFMRIVIVFFLLLTLVLTFGGSFAINFTSIIHDGDKEKKIEVEVEVICSKDNGSYVRVFVFEKNNPNRPIKDATVIAKRPEDLGYPFYAKTNESGEVVFENVPNGNYTGKVHKSGYKSVSFSLTVRCEKIIEEEKNETGKIEEKNVTTKKECKIIIDPENPVINVGEEAKVRVMHTNGTPYTGEIIIENPFGNLIPANVINGTLTFFPTEEGYYNFYLPSGSSCIVEFKKLIFGFKEEVREKFYEKDILLGEGCSITVFSEKPYKLEIFDYNNDRFVVPLRMEYGMFKLSFPSGLYRIRVSGNPTIVVECKEREQLLPLLELLLLLLLLLVLGLYLIGLLNRGYKIIFTSEPTLYQDTKAVLINKMTRKPVKGKKVIVYLNGEIYESYVTDRKGEFIFRPEYKGEYEFYVEGERKPSGKVYI